MNLPRTGVDGRQGIGGGVVGIVVAVDAYVVAGNFAGHGGNNLGYFIGQDAAVGIAQDDPPRPGVMRRLQASQRIGRIGFIAIEEMLGIEYDLGLARLQMRHAVADHGQIFLARDAQCHVHMKIPSLAHHAHRIDLGPRQDGQTGIVAGAAPRPPGHAEGNETGVAQGRRVGKERVIRRIGAGPAALHIIDTQTIEGGGNRHLIGRAEIDPLSLRPIA